MKTSDNQTFLYEKHQLIETICQLRFPTILSIDAKEPADFQDMIRAAFPRYACQIDQVNGPDGTVQKVRNHSFITEDGAYKLNLTKDFISLSTMRYPGWDAFARTLDEPLGQFIRVYKPAFFERIGLRYVNAFSRTQLGLTELRWSRLLHPELLGILNDDSVDEAGVVKCALDVERKLGERFGMKFHAGPGNIRRTTQTREGPKTVQEQETRFILDLDFYTTKTTALTAAAETLEQLHGHADRFFSDAITDTLHNAMEPVVI